MIGHKSLVAWGEASEGKDYRGTLEGNGYVHYLDCGDGFTGVYKSRLTKLQILNICSLLIFNYTSTTQISLKSNFCGSILTKWDANKSLFEGWS